MIHKGSVILTRDMECPGCHRRYREGWADLMFPVCQSKTCQLRWWAMKLHEGDLFTQLQTTFGREGAIEITNRLTGNPTYLKNPMYLQIVIRPDDFHAAIHDRLDPRKILRSLSDAA